jgi:hypothetical protein
MSKKTGVLCMILLWCSMAAAANDSGSAVHSHSWAVGYDEGLAGKFFVTNNISANLSVGYTVTGAHVTYEQPVNLLLIKAGGQCLIKEYRKVRINGFVDLVEMLKQGQIPYMTRTGPNKRFNQWITSGRLGLSPELFIADHVSLTYKFGFILTNFGATYKLNSNESATESNKDDRIQAGVYGFQSDSPFMLLHNISFFVYF